MFNLKFINGMIAKAEIERKNNDTVQIVLLETTYEQCLKLFAVGNYDTIEIIDETFNKVDELINYSVVTSIVILFPKKFDFWKESRIIVVITKEEKEK